MHYCTVVVGVFVFLAAADEFQKDKELSHAKSVEEVASRDWSLSAF